MMVTMATDGIVDGLVTGNLIGRHIDKVDGFRGCDNCCHLLIDGNLLQLLIGLLGIRGCYEEHTEEKHSEFLFHNYVT